MSTTCKSISRVYRIEASEALDKLLGPGRPENAELTNLQILNVVKGPFIEVTVTTQVE